MFCFLQSFEFADISTFTFVAKSVLIDPKSLLQLFYNFLYHHSSGEDFESFVLSQQHHVSLNDQQSLQQPTERVIHSDCHLTLHQRLTIRAASNEKSVSRLSTVKLKRESRRTCHLTTAHRLWEKIHPVFVVKKFPSTSPKLWVPLKLIYSHGLHSSK